MRKVTAWSIVIATGLAVPLLGTAIASASFMPGGIGDDWYDLVLNPEGEDVLERILNGLGKSSEVMDVMMDAALGDEWEDLATAAGSESPNPSAVRTLDDSPGSGVLTVNPIVQRRDVANLYDQELGRSLAAPMLGEEGEKTSEAEGDRVSSILDTNQQGLEQAKQLAEEAQSLSVTQDVVKNQIQMNSALAGIVTNTAELTADNRLALLEVQRLNSIIAQLSANTSEGIDESNRRERVERRALTTSASRAPVYIPGLLGTNEANTDENED
jgi:hypothetical protein